MPILVTTDPGAVVCVTAAAPGLRVDVYAPTPKDAAGVPTASIVVAWATVTDPASVGGVRVEPVFLAGERAWTPDQFRDMYGAALTFRVVPG